MIDPATEIPGTPFDVTLANIGTPTDSGRIYPREVAVDAVVEAQDRVRQKRLFGGFVDDTGRLCPENIGLTVSRLQIFESEIKARVILLTGTPVGGELLRLRAAGTPLRFFVLGWGDVRDWAGFKVMKSLRIAGIGVRLANPTTHPVSGV